MVGLGCSHTSSVSQSSHQLCKEGNAILTLEMSNSSGHRALKWQRMV